MINRYTQLSIVNEFTRIVKKIDQGRSPGLVVMGGDSRSKGHGFESQRWILDGHDIFHIDLF